MENAMRFCGQWSMLLGLAGVFAWCGLRPLGAAGLDWQPEQGYRRAPVTLPASGKTGFSEMAQARTGIQFTNLLNDDRSLTNQIYLNGAGVAAGDVDGDGLCDLYFCGLERPNALYRNLGNWKFADITEAAGVACTIGSNLEREIATAAMAHVTIATPNINCDRFPGDLIGPLYFEHPFTAEPLRYAADRLFVPTESGLGVTLRP